MVMGSDCSITHDHLVCSPSHGWLDRETWTCQLRQASTLRHKRRAALMFVALDRFLQQHQTMTIMATLLSSKLTNVFLVVKVIILLVLNGIELLGRSGATFIHESTKDLSRPIHDWQRKWPRSLLLHPTKLTAVEEAASNEICQQHGSSQTAIQSMLDTLAPHEKRLVDQQTIATSNTPFQTTSLNSVL